MDDRDAFAAFTVTGLDAVDAPHVRQLRADTDAFARLVPWVVDADLLDREVGAVALANPRHNRSRNARTVNVHHQRRTELTFEKQIDQLGLLPRDDLDTSIASPTSNAPARPGCSRNDGSVVGVEAWNRTNTTNTAIERMRSPSPIE